MLVVLGDIHGNSEALKSSIQDAVSKYRGEIEGFVMMGDYVCDFPDSQEVVEIMKGLKEQFPVYEINGNRETGMVKPYYEAALRGEEPNWKLDSTMGGPLVCCRELDMESLKYLAELPSSLVVDVEGKKPIYLQHKMPIDEEIRGILNELEIDTIVTAHTHEAHDGIYDGFHVINPGSVGLTDTGKCGADYCVLDYRNNNWVMTREHVDYDYQKELDKLAAHPEYFEHCCDWGTALELSVKYGLNVTSLYMFEKNRIAEFAANNSDLSVEEIKSKYEASNELSFGVGRYGNVSPVDSQLKREVYVFDNDSGNVTVEEVYYRTSGPSKSFPVEDWMYGFALENVKQGLSKVNENGHLDGNVFLGRVEVKTR